MSPKSCPHVRDGAPAITRTTMITIPGAPTRADPLDTETELCIVCSGLLISTLTTLEMGGKLRLAVT